MGAELDDILDGVLEDEGEEPEGAPDAEPSEEPGEDPAPEPEPGPAADETPEGEEDPEPPSGQDVDNGDRGQPGRQVPLGALTEERGKRQDAQDQLAQSQLTNSELRDRLERLERQQAQPPAAAQVQVPFGEDPETWAAQQEHLAQQRDLGNRLELSELRVQMKHPDYDAKYDAFEAAAQVNPGLVEAMKAAPEPAQFAYDYGAQQLAAKATPPPTVDEIREQVRKEILAEQNPDPEQQASAPELPRSLSDVPGSSPSSADQSEPWSTEALFKRK